LKIELNSFSCQDDVKMESKKKGRRKERKINGNRREHTLGVLVEYRQLFYFLASMINFLLLEQIKIVFMKRLRAD
jgi:hypothetical protein